MKSHQIQDKKIIGVIVERFGDFQIFKEDLFNEIENYVPDRNDEPRRFTINDKIYICIINIWDCRGYSFDEIIELGCSFYNIYYDGVVEYCKMQLKPKKL
jgi:hypothetical protein